jgi:hypothetical protein
VRQEAAVDDALTLRTSLLFRMLKTSTLPITVGRPSIAIWPPEINTFQTAKTGFPGWLSAIVGMLPDEAPVAECNAALFGNISEP